MNNSIITKKTNILLDLEKIIKMRNDSPQATSYTSKLLSKKGLVERKINEEAYELIEASLNENRSSIIEESADLIYHFLVLLCQHNISINDIFMTLEQRRK